MNTNAPKNGRIRVEIPTHFQLDSSRIYLIMPTSRWIMCLSFNADGISYSIDYYGTNVTKAISIMAFLPTDLLQSIRWTLCSLSLSLSISVPLFALSDLHFHWSFWPKTFHNLNEMPVFIHHTLQTDII